MIGDKRMEEPKTESETMDILEHFQILHDPKDYTFNMINAKQLVELNNEVYEKMHKPKKKVICTACNGSGHYDNDGSPKCGCCNGKGYEYK